MILVRHFSWVVLTLICSCISAQTSTAELKETIIAMDSVYFTAYNNCDMAKQAALYSEDIEFYHDMGGLVTSKEELLKGIANNICGKVTRELIENSIEVSEIPGFGAVEIKMHKFHNKEEPDAISTPSKFIALWKNTGTGWIMTRVISLHSN
ncbi:MAG: nuclear transport factor 2 family protein [Flavobacteriaceae bacterium]